ncbi:putative phage tail protein [Vibrio phage 236O40-1]|nr:putative phage tail protein [Vibrio phage 236O40-1]
MNQLQDEDLIAIDNILRTCGTTAMSDKEIRWLNHTKESISDISDEYRIAQKVITQRQKYQLCDYGVLDRVVELAEANGVMLIKQEPEKPKPVIPFIGGGALGSHFDDGEDDDASSGDYDGLAKAWAVGVTGDPTESAPSDTNNSLFYSEQSKIAAKNSDLSRQASEFSAGEAKKSEIASAQSAQQSEVSNQGSGESAAAAKTSEQNAKTSEQNSNQNKLDSAESARQSEVSNQASGQHAAAAKTSETNSKNSEVEAEKSKNSSATSAQQSEQSNQDAKIEADKAKVEADKALTANILMSQVEADAIKSINLNYFDASGMVNMGKAIVDPISMAINEGLWVRQSSGFENIVELGATQGPDVIGSSKTSHAVTHIAGAVSNILGTGFTGDSSRVFRFELPEAEDGTRTFNKATSESITHPDVDTAFALAATSDDIEVVTHPVDLVTFEYYEEELTGVQEIFECIQSLSTTFGTTSVPTVLSTRKLSYFQQYDGQFPEVTANPDFINDRYRCVVWPDLTEPQKREIAAYMGEKLFIGVNGNIVNGRLRARTIRGLGNGDWANIDSMNPSAGLWFGSTWSGRGAFAQGNSDSVVASQGYDSALMSNNNAPSNGAFTSYKSNPVAYQGRCFMYVVATVPRANKGAYVEGLNDFGTRKCRLIGTTGSAFWYEQPEFSTMTLKDCFTDPAGMPVGTAGYTIDSGYIGAPQGSGRPDGIYFDGIYADGLNGVIDWRLGAVANDSPAEASKTLSKVENSTYRGLEELTRTVPHECGADGRNTGFGVYHQDSLPSRNEIWIVSDVYNMRDHVSVGDVVHVYWQPTGEVVKVKIFEVTGAQCKGSYNGTVTFRSYSTGDQSSSSVLFETKINLSVSGELNTKMVIGDPANILLTDALKNGWLGTWCPVIPDGSSATSYPLTRKGLNLVSPAKWIITSDNGATWVSGSTNTIDSTQNAFVNKQIAIGTIVTYDYKAFAKQAKKSNNKSVYNGDVGIMHVLVTNSHELSKGVTLNESVTGKIGTGSDYRIYRPLDYVMENGLASNINTSMQTLPTDASEISSWQINNNWQSSIMFFDGVNYAELTIPLGWIKNKAEAGPQFPKPASARVRRFASYYGTSYN